ncbi:PREDICTED: epidermal growth factor receptor kinase substrate 8-like protein 3 [Tinamus guttatus]|uniref:epidermal growth factor receptor kinase substrate 8-like protein 3 n=1 Tax=Tinamus guttatus TaxID=94827 RepID=UPI00052E9FDE|nr:PREDICTED: epidermal growth factor receptor kinase substrate 8-like protein 3 [Tinamus guttatus]
MRIRGHADPRTWGSGDMWTQANTSGWCHWPEPRATMGLSPPSPLGAPGLDVLNHVLGDLELFVQRVQAAVSSANTKSLWKKKKKGKIFPPEADYRDFFQKIKYALNLLGKLRWSLEHPSSTELLPSIFEALTFVLGHCPHGNLAASVQSPLLIPAAVELLEETLHRQHHDTWQGLGPAWTMTRAEHPEGHSVPAYIPVFSDGWLPPRMLLLGAPLPGKCWCHGGDALSVSPERSDHRSPLQAPATSHRDSPMQGPPFPARELVQAQDEFQGRNAQELTVRRGDVLQVLDQRKKWWLVQNSHGDKGYVPSSILEAPGLGPRAQDTVNQGSPPVLHPGSSPAEVTAWLQDKGFSRLTVKCLGVLSGHQLLHMRSEELRAVCPEEWRREVPPGPLRPPAAAHETRGAAGCVSRGVAPRHLQARGREDVPGGDVRRPRQPPPRWGDEPQGFLPIACLSSPCRSVQGTETAVTPSPSVPPERASQADIPGNTGNSTAGLRGIQGGAGVPGPA